MKHTMGSHVWMDILKWDTENKLAKNTTTTTAKTMTTTTKKANDAKQEQRWLAGISSQTLRDILHVPLKCDEQELEVNLRIWRWR